MGEDGKENAYILMVFKFHNSMKNVMIYWW